MKRVISIILILALLLPVMSVCVSAADVYEFYRYDVSLFADFDFLPESPDSVAFIYDGVIPEDSYNVEILVDIEGETRVASSMNSLKLVWGEIDGVTAFECVVPFVSVFDGIEVVRNYTLVFMMSVDENVTFVGVGSEDKTQFINDFDVFRLSSVSDDIGLSVFLDSFIKGLQDYNTVNLALILIAGISFPAVLVLCWYGYRFVKRKVKKSVFNGKL